MNYYASRPDIKFSIQKCARNNVKRKVHNEDEALEERKSESLTVHRACNQKQNQQSEIVYMAAYVTFLKCQSLER
jgi:hypothetical protein